MYASSSNLSLLLYHFQTLLYNFYHVTVWLLHLSSSYFHHMHPFNFVLLLLSLCPPSSSFIILLERCALSFLSFRYFLSLGVSISIQQHNPLYSGNPLMSTVTFTNSEDPDEKQHMLHFIIVYTVCKHKKKTSSDKRIQIFFKLQADTPRYVQQTNQSLLH